MAGFGDLRTPYASELAANPWLRNRLYALTNAEVGSQGPMAQQAFMESVLNRAGARGQSIGDTIHDRNYYPATTFNRMGARLPADAVSRYDSMLNSVAGGSNVSGYATGNASGTVGFAGGPQTFAANGERYGVEGPDRSWARKAASLPNDGINEVGPLGLTPLHPEIYATAGKSQASPEAPTRSPIPQTNGPTPMDDQNAPRGLLSQFGIETPDFVRNLQANLNTPLAQQGLGLLFAGITGRDPNAGMSAGAERANAATQNLLQKMQLERLRQQSMLMANVSKNPTLSASIPKEVLAGMGAMDPQSASAMLSDYLKGQVDMNRTLELLKKQREYNIQSLQDLERMGGRPTSAPAQSHPQIGSKEEYDRLQPGATYFNVQTGKLMRKADAPPAHNEAQQQPPQQAPAAPAPAPAAPQEPMRPAREPPGSYANPHSYWGAVVKAKPGDFVRTQDGGIGRMNANGSIEPVLYGMGMGMAMGGR